jgi:hypothetical protein
MLRLSGMGHPLKRIIELSLGVISNNSSDDQEDAGNDEPCGGQQASIPG